MKNISVLKLMSMKFEFEKVSINYANKTRRKLYFDVFADDEMIMCDVYLKCDNVIISFSWSPREKSYKKGTGVIMTVSNYNNTLFMRSDRLDVVGNDFEVLGRKERDKIVDEISKKTNWLRPALRKVKNDVRCNNPSIIQFCENVFRK